MNPDIPPQNSPPNFPKNSSLAIWSLVLGILSLICFTIFAGIPAVICGHKALSQIKRSGGAISGQGVAIAGLITGYIGIAWAILFIPLMLAIAIPNFVRAREAAQRNTCIYNLRNIDSAKQMWAVEYKKLDEDIPTEADVKEYLKDGQFPVCPNGGKCTLGSVTNNPTCSIPNHRLEPP